MKFAAALLLTLNKEHLTNRKMSTRFSLLLEVNYFAYSYSILNDILWIILK